MTDLPKALSGASLSRTETLRDARVVLANRAARASSTSRDEGADVIRVVEERLSVGKRRRLTGGVQVATRTEVVDAVVEVDLDRYRVEVTHVPINRVVHTVPVARAEGDTTIIPIVEERLVTVKQLFLVEELHVRHILERETVSEPVTLRRQHAVIQRIDGEG